MRDFRVVTSMRTGTSGAKGLGPRDLAGALVELGEVEGAELGDADEHAGRAAQAEVRTPDLGPAAGDGDAAGHRLRLRQAERGGLGPEQGLESGGRRRGRWTGTWPVG